MRLVKNIGTWVAVALLALTLEHLQARRDRHTTRSQLQAITTRLGDLDHRLTEVNGKTDSLALILHARHQPPQTPTRTRRHLRALPALLLITLLTLPATTPTPAVAAAAHTPTTATTTSPNV